MEMLENGSGVKHLFHPGVPNTAILFAGIQGRLPVHVVVDEASAPRQAGVRTPEGMTFFSPSTDREFIRDGIRKLQYVGPVMAVVEGDYERYPKPDVTIPRREFSAYQRPEGDEIAAWSGDGTRIVPMTDALMQDCGWRELIEHSYVEIDRFLDNAFGFCLLQGDEIYAEAYGAFVGAGMVEIGIYTAEAYRRRGHGTHIVTHLLREIERRGLVPSWSCDESNAASLALARKLGFKEDKSYSILGYRPLKVPDLPID